MNIYKIDNLPAKYLAITKRLIEICEADERVRAALLVGSYARGTADRHSDLDIYLITADEAYDAFLAEKAAFGRQLGRPLFVEDFDNPRYLFLIFPDGAEVEIGIGRESEFGQIQSGEYRVLVEKEPPVSGVVFGGSEDGPEDNVELLRRQLYWFWHDLSHFITAAARKQLWWAQGQLEALRRCAVNLALLKHDFSYSEIGDEVYFKIELAMPEEELEPLADSFCLMDWEQMVRAAWVIVDYYQEAAPMLAQRHDLDYPAELAAVMVKRLAEL